MKHLPYAQSFKELAVYKKSRELSRLVFVLSKKFPREERYSLTDQIRRSSRSIGAQIAEAWSKRRYPKHFVAKLSDADGEQLETQHWIEVSHDSAYIECSDKDRLTGICEEIGRMLGSMMDKAGQFSGNDTLTTKEEAGIYLSPREPSESEY